MDKSAASAKSGASAIAFANLRDAVGAGRPYAAELAAMRSLTPDPVDLGVLPSHAETGIPTVAELAHATLPRPPRRAPRPAPQQAPAATSFLDSMIASAKSAVSIRRVGEDASGAEPSAVLARAETALNQGRPCRRHQGGRSAANASARRLRRLARRCARHSANATLNTLESAVLASFGAPEAKP